HAAPSASERTWKGVPARKLLRSPADRRGDRQGAVRARADEAARHPSAGPQRARLGVPVTRASDPRLARPSWRPAPRGASVRSRIAALLLVNVAATAWYFGWLLEPGRVGNPVLYALLVAAELFNVVQAFGFWWTCFNARSRRWVPELETQPEVD